MPRAPRRRAKQRPLSSLHALGILLLAQSEDEDEELASLLILSLAERKTHPNKWGHRGAYNTDKSDGFCDWMFEKVFG